MSTFLVSVVELSNMVSVLATLLCFFGMMFFIMKNMMEVRLHEDLVFGGTLHHVKPRTPRMQMMKISIPYVLKLKSDSGPLSDCIDCTITSQIKYKIKVYWGVSIRELHMFLWKPWNVLKQSMDGGEMLSGFYQLKGLEYTSEAHTEKTLSIKFPHSSLQLGSPPRLYYPLVIFLVRDYNNSAVQPDDTVALINVVHIKDSVCTLPTSILAQYMKQANGQLSCLKQLYLAAGDSFSPEDPGPFDKEDLSLWAIAGEQLCVVCQYFPLSRALLPCRHTCVCAVCFEKLDRCPMCRSPFDAFFTVRAEDYFPTDSTPPATKPTFLNCVINYFNERLVNFMGHQDHRFR